MVEHKSEVHQALESKLASYVNSRVKNVERVLPASPMQEALVSEMVNHFNHDVLKISKDVDREA